MHGSIAGECRETICGVVICLVAVDIQEVVFVDIVFVGGDELVDLGDEVGVVGEVVALFEVAFEGGRLDAIFAGLEIDKNAVVVEGMWSAVEHPASEIGVFAQGIGFTLAESSVGIEPSVGEVHPKCGFGGGLGLVAQKPLGGNHIGFFADDTADEHDVRDEQHAR